MLTAGAWPESIGTTGMLHMCMQLPLSVHGPNVPGCNALPQYESLERRRLETRGSVGGDSASEIFLKSTTL